VNSCAFIIATAACDGVSYFFAAFKIAFWPRFR
jgi:hypothetical protein